MFKIKKFIPSSKIKVQRAMGDSIPYSVPTCFQAPKAASKIGPQSAVQWSNHIVQQFSDLFSYTMFTQLTNQFPGGGGGLKSFCRCGCKQQGGKLLRILSQLRPRIRPLDRPQFYQYRARIYRPFKEPRNRLPAWRAGTTTLFVVPARQATQAS